MIEIGDQIKAMQHAEGEIPETVKKLRDAIRNGLPQDMRAYWHVAFVEKAATVTDWRSVVAKTTLEALRIAEPLDRSEGRVVAAVIELYERRLQGDEPSSKEWASAQNAARAAARAAADAPDDADAAECASRAASWAAAAAALYAAGAARHAAAARAAAHAAHAAAAAAGRAAWIRIRDAFLAA